MDVVAKFCEIKTKRFWHKKLPKSSTAKSLKVLDCPTDLDAFNLFAQNWFKDVVEKKIFLNDIKFIINKNASKINFDGLSIKKNILISFEGSVSENYAIFWKVSDYSHTINLSKFNNELKQFVRRFLKDSMEKNDRGILLSNTNLEQSITFLGDHRGFNLLMIAIEKNQDSIANLLINLNQFNVNYKVNKTSAIDLAWKGQNFDIVLKLLNANSRFPLDFNLVQASDEIQNFVRTCSTLHDLIKSDNSSTDREISQIIDETKHLRYFFNAQSQSAAFVALKTKKFDIYGLLASKNVVVHPDEDLSAFLRTLPEESQENLQNIHQKFSHSILKKYLLSIYINCFFGLDDFECKNHWQKVIEAFEILDKNVDIQPILELVGNSGKFKIFFDFHRDTTEFLDPTSSDADGKFYFSGIIYIAAKNLLNVNTRNAAVGVLAHELCHFAMLLTYRNCAKPYAVCDLIAETNFNNILNDCQNHELEEIVRLVFECYHPSKWHAELIVRIPHILGHYHPSTIQNLLLSNAAPFRNLYNFYKNQVLSHVRAAISVYAGMLENSDNLKWSHLTPQLQAKIKNSEINFQGEEVTFSEVIGESSKAYNELSSDRLIKLINSKKIIIAKKLKDNDEIFIERKFIEKSIYDEKFKSHLTTKKITEIHQQILKNSKSFSDFTKLLDRVVLLSDYAGAGKTTALIKIARKLKSNVKSNWIQFIDLKAHVQAFSDLKSEELKSKDEVLTFLSSKVLNLNKLETEIFKKLFENGKIIFIFDGVDEISPIYNNFVMSLLKSLNKNQVWIGTRPEYANKIEKEQEVKAFRFLPFSQQERSDFFYMSFKNQNLSGKDLYKRIEVAELIVEKLEKNNNWNGLKDVGNPLIIKMIADESFAHDLMQKINFYSIFESFTEKKLNVFREKGEVVLKQSDKAFEVSMSVPEVHQLYALKLIFPKNSQKLKIHKQKNSWTREQINRYGILHIDNDDDFSFAHRNFAEFFCSKYLIENIFGYQGVSESEARARLKLLFKLNSEIMNFIDNYLDLTLFEIRNEFDETIKKLIVTDFKKILLLEIDLKDILYEKSKNESELNKIKFLTKFFRSSHEIIEALWMLSESENILIYSMNNLFLWREENLEFLEKIYEIANEKLTASELEKLMDVKNHGENILYKLMKICKDSDERISFDCNLFNIEESEILNILTSSTLAEFLVKVKCHKRNSDFKEMIFSNSPYIFCEEFQSSSETHSAWEEIRSILSKDEFKRALTKVNEDNETVLSLLFDYLDDNHSIFIKIIEETFVQQEIFDFFILNDKIHIRLESDMFNYYKPSKFDIFWDFIERNSSEKNMKKLFLAHDHFGRSILHFSLNCSNPEIFQLFLEKYKKLLKLQELKKLFLVEPTRKHQFYEFVNSSPPESTQNEFLEFLVDLFSNEKEALKRIIVQKNFYGLSIFYKFYHFSSMKNDKVKAINSLLLKFVEILKKITSEKEFEILRKELELDKL